MSREDFAMLPGTTVRIASVLSLESLRGCGGFVGGTVGSCNTIPFFERCFLFKVFFLRMNRFHVEISICMICMWGTD